MFRVVVKEGRRIRFPVAPTQSTMEEGSNNQVTIHGEVA